MTEDDTFRVLIGIADKDIRAMINDIFGDGFCPSQGDFIDYMMEFPEHIKFKAVGGRVREIYSEMMLEAGVNPRTGYTLDELFEEVDGQSKYDVKDRSKLIELINLNYDNSLNEFPEDAVQKFIQFALDIFYDKSPNTIDPLEQNFVRPFPVVPTIFDDLFPKVSLKKC